MTDRQTDRQRYSVYNNSPRLRSTAMRPNNVWPESSFCLLIHQNSQSLALNYNENDQILRLAI